MASILIVEDEKSINELLYRNLTLVGHTCACAFDGKDAAALLRQNTYDLLLLDIMLPGISGLDLMREMREETPVILITARAALSDRVLGLDAGADDYIVKPFETLEVIARVHAVLRRAKRMETMFSLKETQVDLSARKVSVRGEPVELTPQEYTLLETLVQNRNLALSREKLLELAWGYDYMGDTRTVDVHIQKLRKKLDLNDQIVTVYKMGYRLETPR